MKPVIKSILILLSASILLFIAGFSAINLFNLNISIGNITTQLLVFTLISVISLVIFFRGQSREPGSQTFHTLVALSMKLLLEMVFALCWLKIAKKSSSESILTFFVLYLCLSLFSVGIILKTLKNRVL